MTKTVVLLNPMGTDVTPYVNGTNQYQLMNGTILEPGDTLYTLPYDNTSGFANIEAGVALLDTKLHATTGHIKVFGYSEGCQIADMWLTNQGASTPIDPADLEFLLIGNADRKYGGFVYDHSIFDTVGWTQGKPDDTDYPVVDLTRQYDPVGDFPTAAPIVDALVGLTSVGTDANAIAGALQAVADVMVSTPYMNAVSNVLAGLALVHTGLGVPGTGYMSVTVDDPSNIPYQEPGSNIVWLYSPTYPVPSLGTGGTFPQADLQLRTQIEQAYTRPVHIPMPNYGSNTGWSVEPFPVPVTTAPVQGWWVEELVTALPQPAALSLTRFAPTVRVGKIIAAAAASLTIAGGVPAVAVSSHRVVTPSPAALSLIGSHPALGVTLRPAGGALTVSGGTPVVSLADNTIVTPSAASLTVTGGAPVVTASDLKIATPAGAALTITGGTPAVVTPQTFTPTGASLSTTGSTPVVIVDNHATPNPAALILTGGTPTVSTPILIVPSPAVLSLIGSHPALGVTLRPTDAALTVTGGTPVVALSDNKQITPTGEPLPITGGTPTISVSDIKIVTPAGATLTITTGAPVVAVPRIVAPDGAALSLVGGTPVVSTPRLTTPTGATLTVTGGTPVVAVSNNIAATPTGAVLTVTGGSPAVTAPRLVTPTGAALTITGGTPVVALSNNQTVTPTGAALTLAGGTPVVSTPRLVTPTGAALTVTGGTPAVTASDTKVVTPAGASLSITGGTPTVTVSASQAVVTGSAAVAATTITIPAHSVGDVIVIFAFRRTSNTLPTVPTAAGTVPTWTQILAPTGFNGDAGRSAYCVATATNHTSGTWTNAEALVAVVISGANASPIGGNASDSAGSSTTTPSAPAVTLAHTDGTSVLLHFYGHRSATAVSAPPAGYTQLALATISQGRAFVNSKDSTTSDGLVSNTVTGAGFYHSQSIEIKT